MKYQARKEAPLKNDPLQAHIYTLKNGLKVFLTQNPEKPSIQTYIAVKAGFKNDPEDTTGLAHYLEHLMFKGSDQIGTKDWEKEAPIIQEIEELFEAHRSTEDAEEKKAIYRKIDQLSQKAAQYAVPNDYDKIISLIGADKTNAYTGFDQTVYLNEIPSNELDRWLKVEAERFKKIVLRLFHTELETVYEEFNMRSMDNDRTKVFDALMENLFQKHPYGRVPGIGKAEHLKNPSMKAVHAFFDQYYVPNNMAICMSGDLDPEETVALIEKHFGHFGAKADIPADFPEETLLEAIKEAKVFGNESPFQTIGYKVPLKKHPIHQIYGKITASILFNRRAGLLDLNLNQKQQVLESMAFFVPFRDYGVLILMGNPKQDQSLKDVRMLILEEVQKVAAGDFEEGLLQAVIKDLKFQEMQAFEENMGRAGAFVQAFTHGLSWETYVGLLKDLEKVTKSDIQDFAKRYLNQGFASVELEQGKDPNAITIAKPEITPIEIDRTQVSDFYNEIGQVQVPEISPGFVNFDKAVKTYDLADGIQMEYVPNKLNKTFKLYWIWEMGKDHDPELEIAMKLMTYLGTSRFTPDALQTKFYALGVQLDVETQRDRLSIVLEGLEDSMVDAIALLMHLLSDMRADAAVLEELKKGFLKERADKKSDKSVILREAMLSYVKYGEASPFKNELNTAEIQALDAYDLVDKVKGLVGFKHKICYYGSQAPEVVKTHLQSRNLSFDKVLKPCPAPKIFSEQLHPGQATYFVAQNMVQAELLMVQKADEFQLDLWPFSDVYNDYFGAGLSSLVYQEIRETKGLAYAAFSFFSIPKYAEQSHYVLSYMATQPDKLPSGVGAFHRLFSDLPHAEANFKGSLGALRKKIATARINKDKLFWAKDALQKRGLTYDHRKDIYDALGQMQFSDFEQKFKSQLQQDKMQYLLIGDPKKIDWKLFEEKGPVYELKIDDIFP